MRTFLSRLFIFFGIFCLISALFFIYQRYTPTRLAFAGEHFASVNNSADSTPLEISINSLNIKLPIVQTTLKKNSWEATEKGVSYLTSSPNPGQTGNSILYGHNWPNLLGKLPTIKPGQEIQITYSDGSKKTFIVEYTLVVSPDQTHILKQTTDTRITLYTCSGFLDSKRFVAIALLKNK